ncbi:DNA-binding transcriptional MerR regulator [Rhodococcus sp. OK519]|uniref:HEAT repeat domain-containing protein n=1 Tax=Rhodococcus sp. OK519 TaxID=2135729 RepID=UPI000D3D2D18|nr:DNA-binding transcriptional MerR regulator [Rhodococcus sp. OK519]
MLIGEVSRRSGVSARMLRHYDALGLVQPTGRTAGGYREYSADDIRRLFHVESLRTLGLSLDESKRALDETDFAPTDLVGDLIRHTRRRIAAEEELLARLEHVNAAAPEEWDDALRIVALLQGLGSESAARRQQAVLSQDGPTALPIEALVDAALSEDDLNVAGALHWSLARSGEGLAALAVGLDSEAVDVRRRAAAAIAEVHTGEAAALLTRALRDTDATIRGRAALALGSRGSADSIPTLLEMVLEGHRDVEAAEVLGALTAVSIPAEDVVELLLDELGDADDPPRRLRITQALAEIPGPEARGVLTRLTRDGNRTIAATAAAIVRAQDNARARRSRPR